MAEYEGNGDFNYSGDGSSDFKRRDNNASTSGKSEDEAEENIQLSEKVNEYIRELLNEKMSMDHKYPHAEKLLEAGELCLSAGSGILAIYCFFFSTQKLPRFNRVAVFHNESKNM